ILVDQGPPEARVASLLRGLGVTRVDAIVLTHPQRDHVGGAVDVLEELSVGRVLYPGLPHESRDRDEALREAAERGVPATTIRRGQVLRAGRLTLEVLWPDGPGAPHEDPNLRSVVLLVTYGDFELLLTGDAESEVTLPLVIPTVDVLKVAHHGSADEGLSRLLEELAPKIAVVSVGVRNRFGHPHESTIAALAARPGLRTLRTDRDGTILIETDGSRITAPVGS
ncbi:MAG: ComEC/Rec2 family competence protein, partial [Gaiellales bacterium]